MNDDALVDIVAAGREDYDVVWYEHLPFLPIAWQKHFIDEDLGGAVSVWCGDLVGDERPEVAVTAKYDSMVVIYEQPEEVGDLWERTVLDNALSEACPISAGDFDGDGYTDIVAAGRAAQTVAWYRNPGATGRTWFKRIVDDAAGHSMGLTAGDVDNDGDPDVAVTTTEGFIAWYENDVLAGVETERLSAGAGDLRAWPNPWSQSVTFSLRGTGGPTSTGLRLFDTEGRLVWQSHTFQPRGHTLVLSWDGRNARGRNLPAGIYFYHLEAAGHTYKGKIVKIR